MTKLEELKAACVAANDTADAARDDADVAYCAYLAELRKVKEQTND